VSAFIATHWWTWPIVYVGIGAFLAGLFGSFASTKQWLWRALMWPFIVLTFIGAFLRELA
jgi:hypothetical protein